MVQSSLKVCVHAPLVMDGVISVYCINNECGILIIKITKGVRLFTSTLSQQVKKKGAQSVVCVCSKDSSGALFFIMGLSIAECFPACFLLLEASASSLTSRHFAFISTDI